MIGAWVPWSDRADSPGWIIDGNGCHIWTGASSGGYGYVRDGGKMRRVSRVRYEREVGPIPAGTYLDHFVCDHPPCCNPRHVRPVSPRENILRCDYSIAARETAKTHCPRGHTLTPENCEPYLWKKRGHRSCLVCHRERCRLARRRYYQKIKSRRT